MSLASSASTASRELTFPTPKPSNKSVGQFSFAQESHDLSREYSSPAPSARHVGNDDSYPLLGLVSPSVGQVASYEMAEGHTAVNQTSVRPPVVVTFPMANPSLAGQASVANNICYACNISFKNASTLVKHQNEFCERKIE